MNPQGFTILAMIGYAISGASACAGLRWENARRGPWLPVGMGSALLFQTVGIGLYCARSETHFFTSWSDNFLLISWALGVGYLVVLAVWKMRALGPISPTWLNRPPGERTPSTSYLFTMMLCLPV